MNKYNERSRCVKCGNTRANSEFTRVVFDGEPPEVIRRECTNCGYYWNELPIDTEELEQAL